mgnify:CR=1 FL=1
MINIKMIFNVSDKKIPPLKNNTFYCTDFLLGLLLSVILLVIGNLATLPIISLVGYGIMSLMFLLAGFTMAILRHTGAL